MRTIPTSAELLEVISDYLRNRISPMVGQPDRFYLIVAANSLDIVRREILNGDLADERAHDRLRDLLGGDAPLEEMEQQLIEAIRTGEISIDDPKLRDHLLRTTLDEVAIDQPKYASYRRVKAQLEKEDAQ